MDSDMIIPAKELACPIAQTTKEKVRNANIIGFNDQLAKKASKYVYLIDTGFKSPGKLVIKAS
jgi:hypothetical protein